MMVGDALDAPFSSCRRAGRSVDVVDGSSKVNAIQLCTTKNRAAFGPACEQNAAAMSMGNAVNHSI